MNITIRGFVRKELAQAVRDPRMRMAIFVLPVIQLTIFGLALSTEIKGIKLKALYDSQDSVARKIEQKAMASGWFVPAKTTGQEPYEWIQSGQADAVFIVPPGGLTRSLEKGKPEVQLMIDATNAVRARGIERYFQAIAEVVLNELNKDKAKPPLITFDVRVLYNPAMETSIFMVPGVMCLILGVITMILTTMSLAREKEIGTFEMLISSPLKNWEILVGKTVPYVILGLIDVPLILFVAVVLFGVPVRGPLWALALSSFIFICASVSIGTLISTFAKSQQQAMMGSFLFLYPSVLLSGLMFPLENMPKALMVIAYLNPLKYFVTLLRNIMLKGGDFQVLSVNLGALVVILLITLWFSVKRFRQTLN